MADLERFTYVDVESDGKQFRIRTRTTGRAGRVFQAVGVAVQLSAAAVAS